MNLSWSRAALPGWAADLGYRMRFRPALKFLGVTAFMWLFFVGYFYVLRHPVRPVMTMPLTALDHALPFSSGAFAAYVSLWLYIGIPLGLMLRARDALIYAAWAAGLCAAGLLLFYLWPTTVPASWRPQGVEGHAGFVLLQGVDASGNACPSLHVAGATFTAFWIQRLLRKIGAPLGALALNWLWLALIVHSTIAIRQHVALDVAGGMLLALPFVWASMRLWRPGPR